MRTSSLQLYKSILFYDISHLLLLLLALIHFLLQLCDLLVDRIKAVSISRTIGYGTDESCIGIFEGLNDKVNKKVK